MAANDLIQLETIVTAVSGSTLTLASVDGLSAGDSIIVESQHGYNETGLDGDWAWTDLPVSGNYYAAVTHIGKSFIAPVVSIAGNVVTVNRAVPVAAVGLPCYRNNAVAIKHTIANLLPWPSRRRFACEESAPSTGFTIPLRISLSDTQATIDFNNCEIFAPRGCGAISFAIGRLLAEGSGGVSNKTYRNLTIRGNVRDSGYGFVGDLGNYVAQSSHPAAFVVFGTGGAEANTAFNCIVENFTLIDNWRSVGVSRAEDCFVYNCRSRFTDPLRRYIQWEYQADSSSRCAFIDCIVNSLYARAGFEPFKCQGVSFIRCGGSNCGFASNSSGGTLMKDCWVDWTDVNPDPAWSQFNPLMNINRTIETSQGSPQANAVGGVGVINFRANYLAIPYPDTNRIFNTINVSTGSHGILTGAKIRGVTLTVPRTNVTTPNFGYIVRSDEPETTASGLVGTLDTSSPYVRQNVAIPED